MRLLLLASLLILCSINIRKVDLCDQRQHISYKQSLIKSIPKYTNPYTDWGDHAKEGFVYEGESINEELGYYTTTVSTDNCYTFCKMEKRCKFWSYIQYDHPGNAGNAGGCYGGCVVHYIPQHTVGICKIFSNVNSQVRYDPSLQYKNYRVYSGIKTSLDKARITDKWQKLVTCDARGPGPAFKKCGYDKTYGMSKMTSTSSGTSKSFTMEFGLEYGWTEAVKTTLKQSSTIGYNWDSTSSETFQTAQTTSTWIEAEEGKVVSICQPVATVEEDYVFRAPYYKSVYSEFC